MDAPVTHYHGPGMRPETTAFALIVAAVSVVLLLGVVAIYSASRTGPALEYAASTDRGVYAANDTATVTLSVTNRGTVTANLSSGFGCRFGFMVLDSAGAEVYYAPGGLCPLVFGAPYPLHPGQTWSETESWPVRLTPYAWYEVVPLVGGSLPTSYEGQRIWVV